MFALTDLVALFSETFLVNLSQLFIEAALRQSDHTLLDAKVIGIL